MDKFKNVRAYHELIFERIGIKNLQDKSYEQKVEEVLWLYTNLCKEFHATEKEKFKDELYKVKTDRRN